MEREKKQVCLVGPRSLQNELMVFFIESRGGIPCSLREGVGRFPGGERKQLLVLFDARGAGPEELPKLVAADLREGDAPYLALFNLAAGAHLEGTALDLGVRGFFYEHDGADTLLKGIKAIFRGELWASRGMLTEYFLGSGRRRMAAPLSEPDLTAREVEILKLLADGGSNRIIAEKLCISPHTVKTHLYRIFRKLKMTSRLQAARWVAERF